MSDSDYQTKWKNKRNKLKNKPKFIQSTSVQSHPIDILQNVMPKEHTPASNIESFTDNQNGFDFFVDDDKYYKECDTTEKLNGNNKLSIVRELIREIIVLLCSPFTKSDKFIYEILNKIARMHHSVDCPENDTTGKPDQNSMDNVSGLLWKKGDQSLQISNDKAAKMNESFDNFSKPPVPTTYTTTKPPTPTSSATNNIASPNITLDITTLEDPVKFYNIYKNLVSSFKENNSWITNKYILKLYQYFQNDLINYIKSNTEFSDSEFLNYTNDFNTTLTDPTVVNKIKNTDITSAWNALTYTILGNKLTNDVSFANKKNVTTPEVIPTEETTAPPVQSCLDRDPVIKKKIKKDAMQMKEMLYELCLIPVLLYISYNFYYVFFFKKTTSQKYAEDLKEELDEIKRKVSLHPPQTELNSLKTKLDDIQEKIKKNNETVELDACYDTTFKDWDEESLSFTKGFPILIEYIFKPIHLLSIGIVQIKNWIKWVSTETNYYPFFAYLFTFVLIYLANTYIYPEIKNVFTTPNACISGYICTGIVMLYYLYSMYQSYRESRPLKKEDDTKGGADIQSTINTGSTILQNLATLFYWLIKGVIAYFFMGPTSAILLMLYIVILLLFGINSENTSISTNIDRINSYIYTSLFKESNFFKKLCRYMFTYMFQILSIIIIGVTFTKYVNKFSDRISAVLAIILGSIIVCIVGFSIVDFRHNEEKINEKYFKNGGIRIINSCPKDDMQLLGISNFITPSTSIPSTFSTTTPSTFSTPTPSTFSTPSQQPNKFNVI